MNLILSMENYHKSYSIRDLNELLNGKLIGDTDQLISGPEQIESATPNAITFIGDKKYIPDIKMTATASKCSCCCYHLIYKGHLFWTAARVI